MIAKPGHRQTNEDIEHVATDGARDGHVSEAPTGNSNARHCVRDARSGCKQGQSHNRVRDAGRISKKYGHPDHEIGENGDENDTGAKGDEEELLVAFLSAVQDAAPHEQRYRERDEPEHDLIALLILRNVKERALLWPIIIVIIIVAITAAATFLFVLLVLVTLFRCSRTRGLGIFFVAFVSVCAYSSHS